MPGELFGPHGMPAYQSEQAFMSGQHLLMLDEILDLSRVEAGRYELDEDQVSLREVVKNCLPSARDTGAATSSSPKRLEPELPWSLGGRARSARRR